EPTGWCGVQPADALPRLRDRRVIPPGWHPVRKDASADDRGPRWHREHMAALHDLLRRLRPRVAGAAWPQRLRRRVPGAPRIVQVLGGPARRALLGPSRR